MSKRNTLTALAIALLGALLVWLQGAGDDPVPTDCPCLEGAGEGSG